MRQKSVFIDVQEKKRVVRTVSPRVNLRQYNEYQLPLRRLGTYVAISVALISFLFSFVYAPMSGNQLLAAQSKDAQRAALESQLKDLESQIAQHEALIAQYQKQGNTLQGEIKSLNAKIATLNLQIKTITLNLNKLNDDIQVTKTKITQTEGDINQYKDSLSNILQTLYEREQRNTLELVLENPRFSDFFLDVNSFLAVQDNLRETLEKIISLKNDLMDQKESLSNQYDDISQLKAYQEAQAKSVAKTESDKKQLLAVTKGQEAKYQQIVAEKKKTAAQIRSQLYELIGGGELSFGDAYNLAKIAADATGVRAALILAVLDRESALGRNVGKCKYDVNPYYPAQANNPTTMHPRRDIPVFLQITQSLGLDPESVFVSCPIPRDGAYGGAMGPAQFLPSTWVGYADRILSVTGSSPANPWSNRDAFVATALYLKDHGAAGGSAYAEKVAAAQYYAGSNYKSFINSYGARVVDRAAEFQDDINVLNG
ncbi:MAG: lytic murein transglycosylase [Patescibacteria group bacterium]|nr:lytic murein transglycosylase [Patescibacteria group bacterium]